MKGSETYLIHIKTSDKSTQRNTKKRQKPIKISILRRTAFNKWLWKKRIVNKAHCNKINAPTHDVNTFYRMTCNDVFMNCRSNHISNCKCFSIWFNINKNHHYKMDFYRKYLWKMNCKQQNNKNELHATK